MEHSRNLDSGAQQVEKEKEIIDLSSKFLEMSSLDFVDVCYQFAREYRGKTKNETPELIITVDMTNMEDEEKRVIMANRLKAFNEASYLMNFRKRVVVRLTQRQYETTQGAYNAFASGVKTEIVG